MKKSFARPKRWPARGRSGEAIAAFSRLRKEYQGSWIERVATERLRTLLLSKE